MAKGNEILLSQEPRGRRMEGYIGGSETPKPGTIMQIDYTAALVGNRPAFVAFNRDADGERPLGPYWVLLEDHLQGKGPTDAYVAGGRCFVYAPLPGDELNLLFGNEAGTADDVTAGTTLLIVDDGTGKLLPTTGSPECEPALALESIVDPTADQLIHCMWTGY